jgi:spore maturation protein CgeB
LPKGAGTFQVSFRHDGRRYEEEGLVRALVYESRQWGGVEHPLTDAFVQLGHSAATFAWEDYLYTARGPSRFNRARDKYLFERVAARINRDLQRELSRERFDLLLVARGDHLYPETIEMARGRGAKTAVWSTDDAYNRLNSTKYIVDSLPLYDRVFSPRRQLKSEYASKGVRSFEVIDWYYRPGLLFDRSAVRKKDYRYEISFVGSWSKRREDLLNSLSGMALDIWGWGWTKRSSKSFFARENCHGLVSMTEMMDVFAATKINVNILTLENRDTTNFRNFEIPAAGAFQLSERSEEVCALFEEGKEIACFCSAAELRQACEKLLIDDSTRENMKSAGYQRLVNGHHAIADRAGQIVAWAEKA